MGRQAGNSKPGRVSIIGKRRMNDLMQYESAYGKDIAAYLERINGKPCKKRCTYAKDVESPQCGEEFTAHTRGEHYCQKHKERIRILSGINGRRPFNNIGFTVFPYNRNTQSKEVNWL